MKLRRRDFNKLIGSAPFVGFLGPSAQDTKAPALPSASKTGIDHSRPWYETKRLWVNFNAHLEDWDPIIASQLNSREIMHNVLTSKGNVFVMFAVDSFGNAYYPTTVGHIHRNLRQRDVLKEIVVECKRQGIAIVLYHSLAWNKYAAL